MSRRRTVLLVGGVGGVVAAGLVILVILTRGPSPVVAGRALPRAPGPVLLVPGYGGATASLRPLAAVLRSAGRDVQFVPLPGDGRGDLDAQAVALDRAAHAALDRTGATSVDVIGYSAGGVVARLWVRDHGGAAIARRVVTLGSPNHGTTLALLGSLVPGACPTACRQLVPGSHLLDALNAGDETPPGPDWVSVWTTVDDVVTPVESARLAGALDQTVQSLCPSDHVGHAALPLDPVVRRIVLAALGPTVARPAPGC